jgi:hypothetical protein
MNSRTTFYLSILALLLSNITYSQEDFDLFNPDRGKPPPPPAPPKVQTPPVNPFTPPPPPPPKKVEPPPPPKPLQPQKDFMLRGTSQIGERRAAVLQGPDGKEIIHYLKNNKPTPLDSYAGYSLLSVESREITVEYPPDAPCRASDPAKGLQCSTDQKTATIKLVIASNALPPQQPMLPPPQPQPQPQPLQPTNPFVVPPTNPFAPPGAQFNPPPPLSPEEQRKRDEEQKKREEIYKNFKRQTIKDEDVPPGMRVVRTPFGDRLVPVDNK